MANYVFNSREQAMAAIQYADEEIGKVDENIRTLSMKSKKTWKVYLISVPLMFASAIISNMLEEHIDQEIIFAFLAIALLGGWIVNIVTVSKNVGLRKGLVAAWPRKNKVISAAWASASRVASRAGTILAFSFGIGGIIRLIMGFFALIFRPLLYLFKIITYFMIMQPLFGTEIILKEMAKKR